MSLAHSILLRVRARGRGAVVTPRDFLALGSRAAVDQALSRLTRDGRIRRIARGVYDLPRQHPRIGALAPSATVVAKALARDSHIQPAPAAAVNLLGLSTQLPARTLWVTDGPSRTVHIGRLVVQLQHVDPASYPYLGTPAGMAISALRHIGQASVSPAHIAQLIALLAPADKARLRHVGRQFPGWLGAALQQIAGA